MDILAHLRSCQSVWAATIYAMLILDNPQLPEIHPRKWAKFFDYQSQGFEATLVGFKSERYKLRRVLGSLPDEAWSRGAMVNRREHNVFSQTRRMALHEMEHWKQFQALLG